MNNIKTVKDFAKSRYTICFLISMLGLLGLLLCPENLDLKFADGLSSALKTMQSFLLCPQDTDILKLFFLLWTMISLVPVFAGNRLFSVIVGGVAFVAGFFMLLFLKAPVFTVGFRLFSLLVMYWGWYIVANSHIFEPNKNYTLTTNILGFFISRMFIGFCCIVMGVIALHRCFVSLDIFLNYPNSDLLSAFLHGNLLILIGNVLMFIGRKASGAVAGLLNALIFALLLLQLPTGILFITGNSDSISYFYETVVVNWSYITSVLLYGAVGALLFFTSPVFRNRKIKSKKTTKII